MTVVARSKVKLCQLVVRKRGSDTKAILTFGGSGAQFVRQYSGRTGE